MVLYVSNCSCIVDSHKHCQRRQRKGLDLTCRSESEVEAFSLWVATGHHPGSRVDGGRGEAVESGRGADTWQSYCYDC